MEEEYELLPHSEVLKLKDELSGLTSGKKTKSKKSLLESMNDLTESINELLIILKDAGQSIKKDALKPEKPKDKAIIEKLDLLLDENKMIAKGIVALADMIKDMQPKGESEVATSEESQTEEEIPATPPPGMAQRQTQMQPPFEEPDFGEDLPPLPEMEDSDAGLSDIPPPPFMTGVGSSALKPMPPPNIPAEPKKKGFLGLKKL